LYVDVGSDPLRLRAHIRLEQRTGRVDILDSNGFEHVFDEDGRLVRSSGTVPQVVALGRLDSQLGGIETAMLRSGGHLQEACIRSLMAFNARDYRTLAAGLERAQTIRRLAHDGQGSCGGPLHSGTWLHNLWHRATGR
jgi:hypothetical protein